MSSARRLLLLTVVLCALAAQPAGAYVYWVNGPSATATIARANNDGSDLHLDFIAAPGAGTSTLAVNGQYIYWGHGFGQASPRTIGRADIGGTNPNPSFLTTTDAVGAMDASATKLYYSTVSSPVNLIHSVNLDGTGGQTVVTESNANTYSISGLALTATSLYRERETAGGPGTAKIIRTDLLGANEVEYPFSGGDLQGLTADADGLFGIRNIGTKPIATMALDPTATVGSVVPGDSRAKYGIAVAGCRLFWSANAGGSPAEPDSIATALTDGTLLNTQLIETGVDVQIQTADIAADLLPAVTSDCSGVTHTPPPPVVDPPKPTPVTPAPIPGLGPPVLPTLGSDVNIKTISDEQLDQLFDQLTDVFFYYMGNDRDRTPAVKAALELDEIVIDEVIARMEIEMQFQYGGGTAGGFLGPPSLIFSRTPARSARAAAAASKAPTLLYSGQIGPKGTSTDGFTELHTALARQLAAHKATIAQTKKVAKLKASKQHTAAAKKKLAAATKALSKARSAEKKLKVTKLRLKRAAAGKKLLAKLRKQIQNHRSVKIGVVIRLTDRQSGKSVLKRRILKVPGAKRSKRAPSA